MKNRVVTVVLVVTVITAVAAGIRMFTGGGAAAPPPSSIAQKETAATPEDNDAWLKSRITDAKECKTFADLLPVEYTGTVYGKQTQLGQSDIEAAVRHAAEAVNLRFIERDLNRYRDWRTANNYHFVTAEMLRSDPTLASTMERYAGRTLRTGETSTADLFADLWVKTVLPGKKIQAVAVTPQSFYVIVGELSESLADAGSFPDRFPFPDLVTGNSPILEALGVTLEQYRGGMSGRGWPQWFPPKEVEARLVAKGTPVLQAGWIVRLDTGVPVIMNVMLAQDKGTKRWWIVQYLVHFHEAKGFNTSGF